MTFLLRRLSKELSIPYTSDAFYYFFLLFSSNKYLNKRMFAAKNVGFSSIFAEIYGNAIETTNCNVLFFKWLSKQSFYKLKYVIA